MADREKVIRALEYLISEDCTDNQFDYADEIETAIALLKEQEELNDHYQSLLIAYNDMRKEQEPISPTWEQGKAYCGNCGQKLPRKREDKEINYCGCCGQEVKWK